MKVVNLNRFCSPDVFRGALRLRGRRVSVRKESQELPIVRINRVEEFGVLQFEIVTLLPRSNTIRKQGEVVRFSAAGAMRCAYTALIAPLARVAKIP